MKVNINSNWSFRQVVEASREAYWGGGQQSRGYRNSVLMAWGNVVGKVCALSDYNAAIADSGSRRALADALGISVASLRKIERHYQNLPEPISLAPAPLHRKLIFDQPIDVEEDREYEFKEVKGKNPIGSIKNTVDEYAVAFLNSEGGRILWGIRDHNRRVTGVSLTLQQRDEVRREVNNKLAAIEPRIDTTVFRMHLHEIYADDTEKEAIEDLFVVDVAVPSAGSSQLYFTGGGEPFVRTDGVKQKLRGPQIQDWIERRTANV